MRDEKVGSTLCRRTSLWFPHLGACLANDDAQAKRMRHRRSCHSRGTGTQNEDIALRGGQRQRRLEIAIEYGASHSVTQVTLRALLPYARSARI